MKKLLVFAIVFLLVVPCFAADDGDIPPPAPVGRNPNFDSIRLVQYTVATLPTAPTEGDRVEIVDGASTIDCTVGGGSDIVVCRWNGSAWVNAGDGQAAGSAEVQNEAYSAANFNSDVTHAPTQDIFYDYMHLIDPDDDGVITDSELSLAGLTLTGSNGLRIGVAGTTMGLLRLYSNVEGNNFYFDLFGGADFTENVGLRVPTSMPSVANALMNADVTTGNMGWTDPADFLLSAGTDNIKDTHLDWGDGAGQIGYADIVARFGSGSCSGYLKSDGTCDTPTGTGDVTAVGDCTTGDCTMDAAMDSVDISPTSGTWDLGALTSLVLPGLKNGATSAGFVRLYEDSDNGTNYMDVFGAPSLADDTVQITFPSVTGVLLTVGEINTPSELETVAGLGAFASDLLGYADATAVRTGLGLVIGTNVQAYDTDHSSIAGGITGLVLGLGNGNGYQAATRANFAVMDTVGTFAAPTTTNPYTLPAANCYGATVYYGATGEIDLPAGVDGMNLIVYNTGAFTITIDPNASEVITRDGTAQTGGVSMTLSSGAGNYVALIFDGTQWVTKGYKGTLAEGT